MQQFLKPLHLACTIDETRPNMALIEIKNGIATATEGHILVKIDLAKDCPWMDDTVLSLLDGKYIHCEVWKEIHKCESLEFMDDEIVCHKNGIVKKFEYSNSQGEFFNTNAIVIEVKEAGEEAQRIMTYNPKFIAVLHKIFKSETLNFSFSPGRKGTVVFPAEYEGMFAILMPAYTELIPNRYIFY